MPKLIRLCLVHSLIGAVVATVFVGVLLAFNVGNLWYLVTHTGGIGPFAAFLLWAHFALLCAGVQFAIGVMRMGDEGADDDGFDGQIPARMPSERIHEPDRLSSVPRSGQRRLTPLPRDG